MPAAAKGSKNLDKFEKTVDLQGLCALLVNL